MTKKIICVFMALMMTLCLFTGCSTKDERNDKQAITITDTDIEYYLPDIIDSHVGFGYDIPEKYAQFNRGIYDSDGTYYIYDSGNKVVFGVSKYFVNEIDDYDMLRCNLSEIKSSNDIFDKLNYKITFLYQNVISKKESPSVVFSNDKLFQMSYSATSVSVNEIDNHDASVYEGTITIENNNKAKTVPIYGYSIWVKSNPIIFYVIDLSGNNATISEEFKNSLDSMLASFKVKPYEWAQEQADTAKSKHIDSITEQTSDSVNEREE